MSVPRSASAQAQDSRGKTVVRVRNSRDGVVYHLMYDGNIGKLSGLQLKQHVASLSHVPVEDQTLSLNGLPIGDTTTGAAAGLQDGSVVQMDVLGHSIGINNSRHTSVLNDTHTQHAHPSVSQPPASVSMSQPPASPYNGYPVPFQQPQPGRSVSDADRQRAEVERLRADIEHLKREEDLIAQRQEVIRRHMVAPTAPDRDEIVVSVMDEPISAPWGPPVVSSAGEASRKAREDYAWKLEQVRFETERMNRQREMRRHQTELEYQAELLDRERVELERKTHLQRMKLDMIKKQLNEDMQIEAQFTPSFYALS